MSKIISNILSVIRVTSGNNKSIIPSAQVNTEVQIVLPIIPQTPSTPTQLLYPEDTTTNSTISTSKDDSTQGNAATKFMFYLPLHIILYFLLQTQTNWF